MASLSGLSLVSSTALAEEPGQLMVVIQQTAIRVGTEDLETLPRGFPFTANQTQGDWVAVANRKSGWVLKKDVLPLSDATAHFSKLIGEKPEDETLLLIRGVLHQKAGEYDKAIDDFSEVLKIDSRNRMAYSNRAIAWKQKGQLELALGDYNEALRLDPKSALTWHNRGAVWASEGNFKRAAADFREAIRLDPELPDAFNALAWIQATCNDNEVRNGKEALENARRACELCGYRRWTCLGTLAAAHAELGNFEEAVQWEQKCLALAPGDRQNEIREQLVNYQARLKSGGSLSQPVASLARQ
jgi:tetratricopeptide (TPR) repeat protein